MMGTILIMIFDLLIILFLLVSIFDGRRRGFVLSFVNFSSFLLPLILGFVFTGAVSEIIKDNTSLYELLLDMVGNSLGNSFDTNGFYNVVPDFLKEGLENSIELIASFILTVISFIIIVLITLLILSIFKRTFSKKYKKENTGKFDSLLGVIFGTFTGALIVLIILAVAIPIVSILSESWSNTLMAHMDSSFFTSYIYHNNPLFLFLSSLF